MERKGRGKDAKEKVHLNEHRWQHKLGERQLFHIVLKKSHLSEILNIKKVKK